MLVGWLSRRASGSHSTSPEQTAQAGQWRPKHWPHQNHRAPVAQGECKGAHPGQPCASATLHGVQDLTLYQPLVVLALVDADDLHCRRVLPRLPRARRTRDPPVFEAWGD